MSGFFLVVFLFSIVVFFLSLVSPEGLSPLFGGKLGKKGIRWFSGVAILISFILAVSFWEQPKNSATIPSAQEVNRTVAVPQEQASQNEKEAVDILPVPTVEVKKETENEKIPFETRTREDATLEKGQTKVTQEGIDGEKEIVYEVTYTDGKETARRKISENTNKAPIDEIISKGTKELQPTYVAPTACGEDYYVNVDGNCVHRPSSSSSGATAQCRDGSYSYSQHRRGTCSGHGGVAMWL